MSKVLEFLTAGARDKVWSNSPTLAFRVFFTAANVSCALLRDDAVPPESRTLSRWEKAFMFLVKSVILKRSDDVVPLTDLDRCVTCIDNWVATYERWQKVSSAPRDWRKTVQDAIQRLRDHQQQQQQVAISEKHKKAIKETKKSKKDGARHSSSSSSAAAAQDMAAQDTAAAVRGRSGSVMDTYVFGLQPPALAAAASESEPPLSEPLRDAHSFSQGSEFDLEANLGDAADVTADVLDPSGPDPDLLQRETSPYLTDDKHTFASLVLLTLLCKQMNAASGGVVQMIAFEILHRLCEYRRLTTGADAVVAATAAFFFSNKLCVDELGGSHRLKTVVKAVLCVAVSEPYFREIALEMEGFVPLPARHEATRAAGAVAATGVGDGDGGETILDALMSASDAFARLIVVYEKDVVLRVLDFEFDIAPPNVPGGPLFDFNCC